MKLLPAYTFSALQSSDHDNLIMVRTKKESTNPWSTPVVYSKTPCFAPSFDYPLYAGHQYTSCTYRIDKEGMIRTRIVSGTYCEKKQENVKDVTGTTTLGGFVDHFSLESDPCRTRCTIFACDFGRDTNAMKTVVPKAMLKSLKKHLNTHVVTNDSKTAASSDTKTSIPTATHGGMYQHTHVIYDPSNFDCGFSYAPTLYPPFDSHGWVFHQLWVRQKAAMAA